MAAVAGVDVGKANLDVSIAEGPVMRFDNTAKGITKLAETLEGAGRHPGSVASPPAATSGCWSAGCGKPGWRCMWPTQAGCALLPKPAATRPKPTLVMPRVLSRYGQVFPEPDVPAPDPEREELRDLLRPVPAVCGAAGAGTEPLGQRHITGRRHAHQAPYLLAG